MTPNRKPYETKDGHIAALVYNDKHWNAFIDRVQPAWNSAEYATLEQRARQIDTVYGLVAQTLKERTTAEWLDLFAELEIPAAPMLTPDALFENEHLNAVGLFEIRTPRTDACGCRVCRPGSPGPRATSPGMRPNSGPIPPRSWPS